ncbi:MAG TPA: T9SS type A sorting domain-containing protein [Flavobacteriales bacterium]|nr:T9SS type A sorting domain-containing protein [Flavobacteriales bacterium]
MKKNSTLQQKLKSYSAVAGAVTAATAVTTDAEAQIIYTDVSPDLVVNVSGTGYNFDLNGDATVDFTVGFQSGTYSGFAYNYIFAYSLTPTTNQIDTVSGGTSAAHNVNDPINATNLWSPGYGTSTTHALALSIPSLSYNIGDWVGATDKYLAFKFAIGANTHYGWARLDVSSTSNSVTVKDFAYESMPSTQILAGATPSAVADIELNNITVFSAGKQINVDVADLQNASVIVRDLTGRAVYASNLNNSFTQINMDSAAEGVYTVTVSSTDGRTTTKKVALR